MCVSVYVFFNVHEIKYHYQSVMYVRMYVSVYVLRDVRTSSLVNQLAVCVVVCVRVSKVYR